VFYRFNVKYNVNIELRQYNFYRKSFREAQGIPKLRISKPETSMGFFDKLFGGKSSIEPSIHFGRYSDSYRSEEQQAAFKRSVDDFENGKYVAAYLHFFQFLRDETEDNVKFWEDKKGLRFELLQGSKKIFGFADEQRVEVETKVAIAETLEVDFMKRLMEKNYSLKYGRFALDDNNGIIMKFNTYVLDGSPYKLYDALKEVATNADKLDDLLLDEFPTLKSVDTGHIIQISEAEKRVKYDFLIQSITETLERIKTMPPTVPSVNKAYCLMSLCYKLDYLIRPEGFIMEVLERINRQYFAHDDQTIAAKCRLLQTEFEAILNRPKSKTLEEIYQTTSTFGVTMPVHHDSVQAFIDGEMSNMEWYIKHENYDVALSSGSYVVGYCLFNYAVPLPIRAFFHLFYQITESDYFLNLGYRFDLYKDENQSFNKTAIRHEINAIVKRHRKNYPNLKPQIEGLDFRNLGTFAQSYLEMTSQLTV
jgi:glycerol-3-phosphate cytidylyltransferase-like family protein